jgi:hypothetical protein
MRNNSSWAIYSDNDDDDNNNNDEAASVEAIVSANSERFTIHRANKSTQEGITTIQGIHHPSPLCEIPFQAHLF